jgi:hypothetical protein
MLLVKHSIGALSCLTVELANATLASMMSEKSLQQARIELARAGGIARAKRLSKARITAIARKAGKASAKARRRKNGGT